MECSRNGMARERTRSEVGQSRMRGASRRESRDVTEREGSLNSKDRGEGGSQVCRRVSTKSHIPTIRGLSRGTTWASRNGVYGMKKEEHGKEGGSVGLCRRTSAQWGRRE